MTTPFASPAQSSTTSSLSSGISQGTEILCLASLIPAVVIILYVCSRIMGGGSRIKKKIARSDDSVKSSSNSDREVVILGSPEASHQLKKKETRTQDLRRYFASPPSEQPGSPPYKPFANHRSSITLKSPTNSTSRLSLRPLSLLSMIGRKDPAKSKLADRKFTAPQHSAAAFSDGDRQAIVVLWTLADAVVGAHPHAKPLLTRLAVKGHAVVRPQDYRLVSDTGADISWYNPPNRGVAVIVPAIARGTPVKAASTSIKSSRYPKHRQPHPIANPPSIGPSTPSNIPAVKFLSTLHRSSHSSNTVVAGSPSQTPNITVSVSRSLSWSKFSLTPAKVASSIGNPDSPRSARHSKILSMSLPARRACSVENTGVANVPNQNAYTQSTATVGEVRGPGLVTTLPYVQPPTTKAMSDKRTTTSLRKVQAMNNTDKGKRSGLKVAGCNRDENALLNVTHVKNNSRGETLCSATKIAGLSGRVREVKSRRLAPGGKENVRPSAEMVCPSF
ncbi:hypothetical protein BDP27DRAFT_1445642 [Rhodocollybia butyracea]|uniref:Uncharacterized protein n=1 Tax=Rhodocollybia butyracea TaxID=206335 RepID=A0A9P5Q024_9AGAR|nr:hypothetical protein BDP27DRAFT_1445642 [Rhodocollybia butyracea]